MAKKPNRLWREGGSILDVIGFADMIAGWLGLPWLPYVMVTLGTSMILFWAWGNYWDRFVEKWRMPSSWPSFAFLRKATVITWNEIKDHSYTCPEVACICAGYEPSLAAMNHPEVQAWMTRLTEQQNFFVGSVIDNATKQTMGEWLMPLYGAIQGGEGENPDLYLLYLGVIKSMKLKRA